MTSRGQKKRRQRAAREARAREAEKQKLLKQQRAPEKDSEQQHPQAGPTSTGSAEPSRRSREGRERTGDRLIVEESSKPEDPSHEQNLGESDSKSPAPLAAGSDSSLELCDGDVFVNGDGHRFMVIESEHSGSSLSATRKTLMLRALDEGSSVRGNIASHIKSEGLERLDLSDAKTVDLCNRMILSGPDDRRYKVYMNTGGVALYLLDDGSDDPSKVASGSQVQPYIQSGGLRHEPSSLTLNNGDVFVDAEGFTYHLKDTCNGAFHLWKRGNNDHVGEIVESEFGSEERFQSYIKHHGLIRASSLEGAEYIDYKMSHSSCSDAPDKICCRLLGITLDGERVMLKQGAKEACVAEKARRQGKTGFLYSIRRITVPSGYPYHQVVRNDIVTGEETVVVQRVSKAQAQRKLLKRLSLEAGLEITDSFGKTYKVVEEEVSDRQHRYLSFDLVNEDGTSFPLEGNIDNLRKYLSDRGITIESIRRNEQHEFTGKQIATIAAASIAVVVTALYPILPSGWADTISAQHAAANQPDAGIVDAQAEVQQPDAGRD